jgi:hypothetical protein
MFQTTNQSINHKYPIIHHYSPLIHHYKYYKPTVLGDPHGKPPCDVAGAGRPSPPHFFK